MSGSAEKFEKLKLLRSQVSNAEKPNRLFWLKEAVSDIEIPKGILVELTGNAKVEWLLQFFIQNATEKIVWCEKEQQINPTAFFQKGLDISRIKFLTTNATSSQSAIRTALGSAGYGFAVLPTFTNEVRVLQRLQHVAEKSQSTVFFLNENEFTQAWPISLQCDVGFIDSEISFNIIRQKFWGGE